MIVSAAILSLGFCISDVISKSSMCGKCIKCPPPTHTHSPGVCISDAMNKSSMCGKGIKCVPPPPPTPPPPHTHTHPPINTRILHTPHSDLKIFYWKLMALLISFVWKWFQFCPSLRCRLKLFQVSWSRTKTRAPWRSRWLSLPRKLLPLLAPLWLSLAPSCLIVLFMGKLSSWLLCIFQVHVWESCQVDCCVFFRYMYGKAV